MPEMSLEDRFALLSQQKQEAARLRSQQLIQEKEANLKNNALVRWNALRHGHVLDDNFTPEELLLAETVEDTSLLSVDKDGHLCLAADQDLQAGDEDAPNVALDALHRSQAALSNQNQLSADDMIDFDDELENEVKSVSPEETENIQIQEDVKVLRIETIQNDEARLFVSVESNPLSHESAYAYYLERGLAEDKSRVVIAQSGQEEALTMLFYAVTGALQQSVQPNCDPIKKLTIYTDRSWGEKICQNSGAIMSDPSLYAVQQYREQLNVCRKNFGIEVYVTPSKSHGREQHIVEKLAKNLIFDL